ncbi:MAG TPA: hypothetical protein VJX67_13585 [Blastocatellia bacterium]|nr:hypothetical protein [Blastocatellia bacterium]
MLHAHLDGWSSAYYAATRTVPTMPFAFPSGAANKVDAMSIEPWNVKPFRRTVNRLKMPKAREAFEHKGVRIMREKQEQTTASGHGPASTNGAAVKAARLDRQTEARLARVADIHLQKRGRITKPTALFVDRSGSVEDSIEVGKRLAAIMSAIAESALHVYLFNSTAASVKADGTGSQYGEKAFPDLQAVGRDGIGSLLEDLRVNKVAVEQIVIVTGERESAATQFANAYDAYCRDLGTAPSVIIIKLGQGGGFIESAFRAAHAEVHAFTFNGDYRSLSNLVPILSRPSRLERMIGVLDKPVVWRGN